MSYVDNLDNELLEASKISDELLMDYIRGGWIRVVEAYPSGTIKDVRVSSLHTFEYMRRYRTGNNTYNLDPLYKLFDKCKYPIPKVKITVEPGCTIVFSYERAF